MSEKTPPQKRGNQQEPKPRAKAKNDNPSKPKGNQTFKISNKFEDISKLPWLEIFPEDERLDGRPWQPLTISEDEDNVSEVAKAKQETRDPQETDVRGRLHDLHKEALPSRPKIFSEDPITCFDQLAKIDYHTAAELLERCRNAINKYRPLSTERVFSVKDAAGFLTLSEDRVYQFAEKGRIGEKVGKRWKFSESELVNFSQEERKTGRPSKAE